jgi:hypothetical protein
MEYSKGKWEQTGTLIVTFGQDGAVICKMAEPYPESGLAEFKPLQIGSKGWNLQMANTHLIIESVNACTSVNPDNPLAVAQSVKAMYEALKAIKDLCNGYTELPKDLILESVSRIIAKAEGNK